MSAKTILASGFLLLGGALLLLVSSLDYSDFYSLFGLLFTLAHRLGIRAGSICVSHTSMVENTPYYVGPKSEEAYPWAFEPDFMAKRILQCSKIATRAVELLDELLKEV